MQDAAADADTEGCWRNGTNSDDGAVQSAATAVIMLYVVCGSINVWNTIHDSYTSYLMTCGWLVPFGPDGKWFSLGGKYLFKFISIQNY